MQEELTVRVEHPELPAIRWNEAEVQQNLTEMLAAYTGRVYTPETIKDAKADRAAVNKLDKQLSDAARSAKAFYMKPLEEFLQSAKQMQSQCKAVSGAIDAQVKAVEEAERQDKADALQAVYADCIGELLELIPFDRLLVPQQLNKTYDLAKASRELRKSVETRREELREAFPSTFGALYDESEVRVDAEGAAREVPPEELPVLDPYAGSHRHRKTAGTLIPASDAPSAEENADDPFGGDDA